MGVTDYWVLGEKGLAQWIESAMSAGADSHADAVELALVMLAAVADEKRWTDSWTEYGTKIIAWSEESTPGNASEFWSVLTDAWNQVAERAELSGAKTAPNWSNLGRAYQSARDGQLRADQAPSGLEYAWEFVVESATDLRGGIESAGAIAEKSAEAGLEAGKAAGSLLSGKGGQILALVAALFVARRVLGG